MIEKSRVRMPSAIHCHQVLWPKLRFDAGLLLTDDHLRRVWGSCGAPRHEGRIPW